ncbi:MAG: hypothetical protein ACRYG5_09250 [Janthinobacterium lividum]
MKKTSLAVFVSLMSAFGAAVAQSDSSGVTQSSDPAQYDAIQAHAQALQSSQAAMSGDTMHHWHGKKPMHRHHAAPAQAASQ